jgi:hypothetical protein
MIDREIDINLRCNCIKCPPSSCQQQTSTKNYQMTDNSDRVSTFSGTSHLT